MVANGRRLALTFALVLSIPAAELVRDRFVGGEVRSMVAGAGRVRFGGLFSLAEEAMTSLRVFRGGGRGAT